MELSIQEVARATGTTSRTLRHYDDIGLLTPSRIGHNGYRYYDDACLVRLQRILLLRELGLRLPQIALVLDQETSETTALTAHLGWLRQEQDRIARQIASVEATVNALQTRSTLMADTMFDGFDHTKYREEVEERWGKSAYADSDRWWRGLDEGERGAWQRRVTELSREWSEAAERGIDPAGTEAQDLAARHVDWLRSVPGTPASTPGGDLSAYVLGLADMYVADPRFAANYATSKGGSAGAAFVRNALRIYVEAGL